MNVRMAILKMGRIKGSDGKETFVVVIADRHITDINKHINVLMCRSYTTQKLS
jgi:hypothetical protein